MTACGVTTPLLSVSRCWNRARSSAGDTQEASMPAALTAARSWPRDSALLLLLLLLPAAAAAAAECSSGH